MLQFDRGFIMLCDANTEEECLRRNLFGDKIKRLQDLNEIKPGDIGLLFNFDKDELMGIFRACSKAQVNIEPKAWNGKFPAQVRVELIGQLQRIKDATYLLNKAGAAMGQMASGIPIPHPVHGRDVGEKILSHFKDPTKPA
jgi:hypothetical protein